jgi:hypothetical protein
VLKRGIARVSVRPSGAARQKQSFFRSRPVPTPPPPAAPPRLSLPRQESHFCAKWFIAPQSDFVPGFSRAHMRTAALVSETKPYRPGGGSGHPRRTRWKPLRRTLQGGKSAFRKTCRPGWKWAGDGLKGVGAPGVASTGLNAAQARCWSRR